MSYDYSNAICGTVQSEWKKPHTRHLWDQSCITIMHAGRLPLNTISCNCALDLSCNFVNLYNSNPWTPLREAAFNGAILPRDFSRSFLLIVRSPVFPRERILLPSSLANEQSYCYLVRVLALLIFSSEYWLPLIIIIKMFNRHILALKMNYNVFTRFGKLQKPNWDWVYKIIENSNSYRSYINFNHSY